MDIYVIEALVSLYKNYESAILIQFSFPRGEDPIGNWTIRVSDQEDERSTGNFLGWRMSFWGSSIDASKANPYEFRDTFEKPFPTSFSSNASPASSYTAPSTILTSTSTLKSSTTKVYLKPTDGLISDPSIIAEVTSTSGISFSSSTANPTQDVIGDVSLDDSLLTGQSRLKSAEVGFGVVMVILLVFLGAGIFYWRKSRSQAQSYIPVDEQNIITNTSAVHTLGDDDDDDDDDEDEDDEDNEESHRIKVES